MYDFVKYFAPQNLLRFSAKLCELSEDERFAVLSQSKSIHFESDVEAQQQSRKLLLFPEQCGFRLKYFEKCIRAFVDVVQAFGYLQHGSS
jgi:hypothetical protein